MQEAESYGAWLAAQPQPWQHQGFNRRHVPLASAGLDVVQDTLLKVCAPLAAALFPSVAADQLGASSLNYRQVPSPPAPCFSAFCARYAYIVGYSSKGAISAAGSSSLLSRVSLVPHTDDSEVTLNVGLGRQFEGGALRLRGLRCAAGEGRVQSDIMPRAGCAVLHLGQHLHEVTPVTAGERYALIMWMRSQAYRAATCPCCVTFRRERCICAPSWN
jgi:hypothetical protein